MKCLKAKHELPKCTKDQPSAITKDHENAVSGYVCRKVQENIKSSAIPHKDDMILFICDLIGDEWDEEQGTEERTNAINRGRLWHVSDSTYSIFYLMEEEIQKQFIASAAKSLDAETKERLLDAVLKNEDLLFEWSILTSAVSDDMGSIVIRKMAELYNISAHCHPANAHLICQSVNYKSIQ